MTRRAKRTKKHAEGSRAIPAGATLGRPLVAIVGRPNVGKSTLFNRLAGQRLAIVEDLPGVTRDRHYADAWILGREVVLIDTGGFDPESDDPMRASIAGAVKLALEECDVVVCVLDASADPMTADREAIKLLRGAGKPVVYVANKADSRGRAIEAMSHYELGVEALIPVSSLHGHGIGDLEEAIRDRLPPEAEIEDELDPGIPRIAVVGRPNAGKSSLVNALLGEARQIVDDRPGTTIDSVDTLVERNGERFVLIDTAGIRRRRSVGKSGVEAMSIFSAIRAIERSDVVVLLIDANEGVGEQDAKIAGLAVDRGRALVIGLNKSDLLDRKALERAETRAKEILTFASWAALVALSAKTGRGVGKLLDRVRDAVERHRKRVSTAEINRFFEEVLDRHPPPTQRGRSVRLFYVSQVDTKPPTFAVVTNEPDAIHFSYQRYVVNQIRERFGFEGTPVRVRYRAKRKRERSSGKR